MSAKAVGIAAALQRVVARDATLGYFERFCDLKHVLPLPWPESNQKSP
jgi:hypothetical protein